MAPSLKLEDNQGHYPYCIKPEKQLSVHDIFRMSGDHYEGTQYDLTKGPLAGPYGDPLNNYGLGGRPRPIGIPATCYLQVSQTKSWLPDPIKGIVWYGYGSVGHTFLTPLFAAMDKLPDLYGIGSRYEIYRRDSGWWINTGVQAIIGLNYAGSMPVVNALREPRMANVYKQMAELQDVAAKMYASDPKAAVSMLSDYCYNTSVSWFNDWLKLGDQLMQMHWRQTTWPQWWRDWSNPAVNTEIVKYLGK